MGLDVDAGRIAELERHHDRTGEIAADQLAASSLHLIADPAACPDADVYIVTMPTRVNANNKPDLSIVMLATRIVAGMLKKERRTIIVCESTVYPGVTEDMCGLELEHVSGLVCGEDFFLAYSPERINPGAREHTVERITKVVSGQTPAVLDAVADLYGRVTSGGVFRDALIKAAEAAKVIENAQRDINIAFVNEITTIFQKMDLSVWDVLAAGTEWNFLKFEFGLVGGHCSGVDPYYLARRASELGRNPRVILAGRGTNDGMAAWCAAAIHRWKGTGKGTRTLVLGLAFKPDVPDLRNPKVVDLIAKLRDLAHDVDVHDPLVSADEARHEYGIDLVSALAEDARYDLVVLAVPHREIVDEFARFAALVGSGRGVADLKNALADTTLPNGVERWTM